MAWGVPLATFTAIHVALSLAGIAAGLVVMAGLLRGREGTGWTTLFLLTTIATSVTGFGFPVEHLLPSHVVGVISLVVLAVAVVVRYGWRLHGRARSVYLVSAATALYLNVFVGVVQVFLKVPALHALAPQGTEPAFLIAQIIVLALFIVLTVALLRA